MRKSKYNSFDELPLMLTVEDVSHVLGIGLAHAYEVAHRRDFPTIMRGSLNTTSSRPSARSSSSSSRPSTSSECITT